MFSRHSLTFAPALLAGCLIAAAPALAQSGDGAALTDERPRTIVVNATGEAMAAPDRATATFAVLREADEAQAAMAASNEAMRAATQAMRDLGIESRNLQTAGFSLEPRYSEPDQTRAGPQSREIVGYTVRNTLAVTVTDVDRLGEVLDRAVKAGANADVGIAFSLADPSGIQDAARRDAMDKARASAQVLAESAGVSLGAVRTIDATGASGGPGPQPMMMRAMAAESSVPIETGETSVTASVRVEYDIAP